jgi:hypothetical protein
MFLDGLKQKREGSSFRLKYLSAVAGIRGRRLVTSTEGKTLQQTKLQNGRFSEYYKAHGMHGNAKQDVDTNN